MRRSGSSARVAGDMKLTAVSAALEPQTSARNWEIVRIGGVRAGLVGGRGFNPGRRDFVAEWGGVGGGLGLVDAGSEHR